MNKILLYLALLILLLLAEPSLADGVFTWKQCVELAAANNNALKAAIATQKSAEYQRNSTASGFFPQASANLISNRGTGGNASNPSLSTTQSNISQTYTTTISVTQNVFSGFQDVGKFDQAQANIMVSKANVRIVKAQVSYDLKTSYSNLIYAKESVKLLDEIIRRREENLRIIEMRYKSGMENKGSLLLAQAYLEQAKYDRLQGANLVETARAQLCKAMGFGHCGPYEINGPVPTIPPRQEEIDFKMLIEKTPQHQQAVAQDKAAKAGIKIAESGFMPNLNLVGTKGWRGTTFMPQNDYWTFAATLSFPFFTGGKDYYSTLSAYAEKSAARDNLEAVDQQALVSLKQSYNSYVEAISKLKVDKSFQEAAKLRADIARAKYNNGLLIFEDWDAIENDLIARQKSYLQSKRDRVISEAAWEQSQGKGVFTDD